MSARTIDRGLATVSAGTSGARAPARQVAPEVAVTLQAVVGSTISS